MKQYLRPPYLKKGDTVYVMAVASSLTEESRKSRRWIDLYESWGLKIKTGRHLLDTLPGEFAGKDEDRAADLEAALKDPEVKAIISYRGGYGTMRTMDVMDTSLFKKYPKWLVGFSDITIAHAVLQNMEMESIHGIMPSLLGEDSKLSEQTLHQALWGELEGYRVGPHKYSRPGHAQGRLVGGNLALYISTLGTVWENKFDEDSILFIEDITERMYTVDRMLRTLKCGGRLAKLKGIIIGQFSEIGGEDEWQRKVYDLINEYTAPLGIPVIFGFPCGHEQPTYSLYMGREITIDVDENGADLKFL